MRGIVSFRDKKLHFSNWGGLTIQVDDKFWFLYASYDEEVLRFRRVQIGTRNSEAALGQELRRWRTNWGYTQKQDGKELGISQAMVSKIEKGHRPMPPEIFLQIRQ